MRISITANTKKNSESFGFLIPILQSSLTEKLCIFGEGCLQTHPKIIYYADAVQRPLSLKLIVRLLRIIYHSLFNDILIGIYEIPHGFFAFLAGKILHKKTILCIIGNPAYTKIRRGMRQKLLDLMIRRMDATTVTGTISRRYLIEKGHNQEKIFVLPNAVDTTYFRPCHAKKIYDIISLGRLSPEKELINLLKVVLKLKDNYLNIKVGIAGSGPDKLRLDDFIANNDLRDNINLLGYIENKLAFYNSGKIFMLTSSTEGLPRTVIESMACGVPCITSNVGDLSDLVHDNENGVLIEEYSNLEQFTAKALVLLNDENLRSQFSMMAREHVVDNYSYQCATIFWDGLYAKMES